MKVSGSLAIPGGRGALFALAVGSFGIGTSQFFSAGIVSLVASDFAIGVADAAHSVTAYSLGVVVGAPLITLAAARLNRRTLLLLLMSIFVIGDLISAMANALPMLFFGRFVAGLPHAAFFGAGAVVASHIVGVERTGKAFALVLSGLTIATIVGAPLGTFLAHQAGWRGAYLVLSAYGCLALIAFYLWLPKTEALGGQPIARELSALGRWHVWAIMLVATIAFSSIFAVYTFIGPFVTDGAGLPANMIPIALSLYGAGMALGNIAGGRLADRYSYRGIVIGLSATAIILSILASLGTITEVLFVTLFALGFTSMMAIPTIPARLSEMAPEGRSLVGAMNIAALNLANAVGAAVGGAAVAAELGLMSPAWAGLALTVIGLCAFAVLFRSLPKSPALAG